MPTEASTPPPNRMPTQARGGVATIASRMERLPWCRVQRTLFLTIATAWLFDSMDLGAMTFLLSPISHHFALSATQAGVLGSASFAGMFFGAMGAGVLADRFGRQRVFKYSIVVWGVASIALALAWNFESLIAFRFVLGVGMGAEFPVAAAILAEFMPSSKRGRYAALLEGAWPLGFIAAGAVSYLLVASTIGWRGFFAMQAVLAVIALILRRHLPESPRWLASRGQAVAAERTLGDAGEENWSERVPGGEIYGAVTIKGGELKIDRTGALLQGDDLVAVDLTLTLTEASGRENAAAIAPPRNREDPWPNSGFPSADASRISSWYQQSRFGSIVSVSSISSDAARRITTMTCSMDGQSAAAASASFLSGTRLPRR